MTASPAPTVLPPASWRRSWPALVLSTLSRIVLGALGFLLAASVLPVVIGWQSSVVVSGSMTPALSVGDVAVVRPVDAADLRPGQVLLVDDPDVAGRLRVHRLVAVQPGGLQLKGDANPAVDGSLVAPSAVHGAVMVGLPLVGRPAVWAVEGRVWPLVGTAAGLAALLALAVLYRPGDETSAGPPAAGPARARRPRRSARRLRRGTVAAAAVVMTISLPGASAGFSDTTRSPALTFPVAALWNCTDVAGAAGPGQYYRLQDVWGSTASNTGTSRSAGNGTYAGDLVSTSSGPPCGANDSRAIVFNGTNGQMYSTQAVAGPQSFSVQLWFNTRTTNGGKLIGFGNGTDGDISGAYDRHVYMTNSGQLVFGIFPTTIYTVSTSRAYNDGGWHMVTATFSASTGMRLYVDGSLISSAPAPAAENTTGFWRVGYDNLNTWPAAPRSNYFAGSLAHVSIHDKVLSAAQVGQAWQITR